MMSAAEEPLGLTVKLLEPGRIDATRDCMRWRAASASAACSSLASRFFRLRQRTKK